LVERAFPCRNLCGWRLDDRCWISRDRCPLE